MNNKTAITDQMMAPLIQKYVERLVEKIPEIESLLVYANIDRFTTDDRDNLRRFAHILAGSGASYGFPSLSSSGRALEDLSGPPRRSRSRPRCAERTRSARRGAPFAARPLPRRALLRQTGVQTPPPR